MTSSTSRSKKCPPSAMPSRPFSMIRKNGSSALNSSRSVIVVMLAPRLCPRLRSSSSELRESDRRSPGDLLDVVVGPGALSGGNGCCQRPEHLAVIGGHAGGNGALDPHIAVDVVVLHRLSADVRDDLGVFAHRYPLMPR